MRRSLALTFVLLAGCASAPSPLSPQFHGSIGTPACGVLSDAEEVRPNGASVRWLRDDGRHWALARFARAIDRAARSVARERPGAVLSVGDLSTRSGGGPLAPHFSHRSGRDADLLFYVVTPEGAPIPSPGFVHFGADGLARDEAHKRWLRLDVEREWLLVKALVEDREARVQWLFVSEVVQAMLIEWALARGEPIETIRRAVAAMAQPGPGGVHDDHIHVRTACSREETVAGCLPTGPRRGWWEADAAPEVAPSIELAMAIFRPLETSGAPVATSDGPVAP